MHIADVADLQKINSDDVFPLEMPCFDEIINGGVSLGDVVIIAGQTGHGKTTLAQDWTMSLIRGEKSMKALWFSYEVLPVHLWKKFKEMGMSREDCAFIPAKHSTGNVAWVEQKIKEGKEKFGTRAVFIDHLGFLLPKTNGVLGKAMSANYASFLTQIMRDLKTLALQEEVVIFLPVHMKKVDSRNRMSDSDDIKDSSGIGQESDLVFLIEREKNKEKDAKTYFTDMTKITLAKNRKTGATLVANFSMVGGRFAYGDSNNEEKKSLSNYAQLEAPNAYDQDDDDVEAEPTQQVMIGE
jgi:replicative DNA helicase